MSGKQEQGHMTCRRDDEQMITIVCTGKGWENGQRQEVESKTQHIINFQHKTENQLN